MKRRKLEFPVLSDIGNSYARELSLAFSLPDELRRLYLGFGIDLEEFNGDSSWALPIPTRLVVDRDGLLREIESDPDYTSRPEPEATLRALEERLQSTSQRLLSSLRSELDAERRRSHQLLLNVLPAPIAAELRREGRVEPVFVEDATVLFTDIEGFTTAARCLSPAEVVARLSECFSAFDAIVEEHGVEKLKTIGDAYMCASGLLGEVDDHTLRMTRAAFAMRDWFSSWARRTNQGEPWRLRIGMHSGPLVAGVIGSKKFSYDVWGDTVNVASRLESNGVPGRVNVSQAVVDVVKGLCHVEARGAIPTKNRGRVEMYLIEPRG